MNTNSEQMIYLIGNPTEGFHYSHGPYAKDFGGYIYDNDHPLPLQAAPARNPSDPETQRVIMVLPDFENGFKAIGPITTEAQAAALAQQHPHGELLPLRKPDPDYMPGGQA